MVSRRTLPLWLASLTLLAAGCARTTLQSSVVDEHAGLDATAEMDFWDGLATVRTVSNNDALHALLLSFGGAGANDYAGRLAAARKRGWIRADEDLPANETARVGWIARAVVLQAGIKGGVTMRVFGAHERYAVRELNYRGWLPDMSRRQAISGAQLIALLSRAEDHQEQNPDSPREDI